MEQTNGTVCVCVCVCVCVNSLHRWITNPLLIHGLVFNIYIYSVTWWPFLWLFPLNCNELNKNIICWKKHCCVQLSVPGVRVAYPLVLASCSIFDTIIATLNLKWRGVCVCLTVWLTHTQIHDSPKPWFWRTVCVCVISTQADLPQGTTQC